MLTYHLKPHDQQTALRAALPRCPRGIMSGALPGGTRLPSKRQLAANLRVSQITVKPLTANFRRRLHRLCTKRGYFVQEQLAVPVSSAGAICTAFAADFRIRGDLSLRFSHRFCR